jgi:mannose-6-phosphate isomerase-like protein (cupin superfamily)
MRALMKIGFGLLVLAMVLVALSYSMLRAHGISGPTNPEGRIVTSETRTLDGNVEAIELSGPINLTLRQGAVASMVVTGEQRLLSKVETNQDGATLHIGIKGMLLHHRQPLQVVMVLPSIERLDVTGSGQSIVNGFSGEKIDVRLKGSGNVKFTGRFQQVSAAVHGSGELEMNGGTSDSVDVELVGSGDITVVGACKKFKADQTGSGDLNAQHLDADDAVVNLHGSGSSIITAKKVATVVLRGSGDVNVYGSPDQRSVNRTGSGDVTFN